MLYKAIMCILAINIFCLGLTFGIDRELARGDYVKGNQITGCIFESNCNFYRRMK